MCPNLRVICKKGSVIKTVYDMKTKNEEWALKAIPILIHWAKTAWKEKHYYSDLSIMMGHKTNQIGSVMLQVHDIMKNLEKHNSLKSPIPTLNALVRNKETNLPSDGFSYVMSNYDSLSTESKKGEIENLNLKAHEYDWDWVEKALGVNSHIYITSSFEKKMFNGFGGESEKHKQLKEFVKNNPDKVGIKSSIINSELEYILPSGDKLDVYFESSSVRYAIEVKSSTSPESDVLRGIFQCVKYKAVLEASRVLDDFTKKYEVILVLGDKISVTNKRIATDLKVSYIDNFIDDKF